MTAATTIATIPTFIYAPGSSAELVVSQPIEGDTVMERTEHGNVWVRREVCGITRWRGHYEVCSSRTMGTGWFHADNIRNVVQAAR